MAGNDEMDVFAILTDEGPADRSIAHHGSRAVHCLDTSQRSSIEDDVDDVVARIPGDFDLE